MRRRLVLLLAIAVCASAAPAVAQQRDTTKVLQDTIHKGVSPRSAFIRSLILPGWGQISVHAYTRAAAFVTLQGTSWYMLVKTLNKVSAAHKRIDEVRGASRDTLLALTDTVLHKRFTAHPDSLELAVDTFSIVKNKAKLLHSREEQRQDWITYTLFSTLASGVDAFVAAHLADFPATIITRRQPNGAYQLKVTVPFPRRQ